MPFDWRGDIQGEARLSDRAISLSHNQANSKRKEEHLRIALNTDVEFKDIDTRLDDYQFVHQPGSQQRAA